MHDQQREQSWAYKVDPGFSGQPQYPYKIVQPYRAEMSSEGNLGELPGNQHVSELDVDGRK